MSLKIGRATFGREVGRETPATVSDVSTEGDEITISGSIHRDASLFGGDADAVVAAATQRTNGLINSRDEPVVPLVWGDGPPDMDGFYRVIGGRVDRMSQLTPKNGRAPFSLTLQRVTGYTAPMFEAIVRGAARAGLDTPTAQAFMALPASVKGYEIGENLTPNFTDRDTPDGPVTVFTDAGNTLFDATPSFFLDPEDWYTGAATLRVGGEVVAGRQVRNLPDDWQISNGLVRISPNLTALGMNFTTEKFDGSNWSEARKMGIARNAATGSSVFNLDRAHTVTVIRNSPEEVAIRLTSDAKSAVSGARFAVTVDLSVRRGSRMVSCAVRSRGDYRWRFGWILIGSDPGPYTFTSVGAYGAYREGWAVGFDENMEFYHDFSGGYVGRDTVGVSEIRFAVGYYGSGSEGAGDTGIESATSVIQQWAAAMSEHTDAVVR